IKTDRGVVALPVRPICKISLEAENMTSKIVVSLNSTCPDVALYSNRTRIEKTHVPQHSGLYRIVATTGVFYNRTTIVVWPNVSITGNVFGQVMAISLSPPPMRGIVAIGPLRFAAGGRLEVDTWQLGAGNYTMVLTISGISRRYDVVIHKAAPRVELTLRERYTYGEPVEVKARVYVGNREYGVEVRLWLNNTFIAFGKAPLAVAMPPLDVGVYMLQAATPGDRNVTSAAATAQFLIQPAPVWLDLKLNNTFSNPYIVNFGKVVMVTAVPTSLVQPVGRVEVFLNGRPWGPVVDTLDLLPGEYNLTAVFTPATKNFLSTKTSVTLYILPSPPEIYINKTFHAIYGQPLVISFKVTLFGRPVTVDAVVEISGGQGQFSYKLKVERGTGSLTLTLPAGTYLGNVRVSAPGLIPQGESFNLFVYKAPSFISLEVPQRGVYGSLLPIDVAVKPSGIAGRLFISINGTVLYAGNATAYRGWWPPPRGGVFQITARFESLDPNYAGAYNTTYVHIDRARCVITFMLRGAVGNTVYVLRQYAIWLNTTLPTHVEVNGSRVGKVLTFNKTGVYNITVAFPGDDSYYPCAASRYYTAVKNPTVVSIAAGRKVTVIERSLPLYVNITSPVGRKEGLLEIFKKNLTVNYTDVEIRQAEPLLYLQFANPGVYEIVVNYTGNPYQAPNMSNIVTVTVEPSFFGIPTFLVAIYVGSLALGLGTAFVIKKIFKEGI
ncbi:MAG: hypothetical protein ACK4SY_02375, partial [Pyrobaculum sp.]